MKSGKVKLYLMLIGLLLAFNSLTLAQINDFIINRTKEWNKANNENNIQLFNKLYAPHLSAYGRSLSKQELIELKKKLFQSNPAYFQGIEGNIEVMPESDTMIKVEFTKYAFKKKVKKVYPSYLVFTKINGEWLITNESDRITDSNLANKGADKTRTPCANALIKMLTTSQWFKGYMKSINKRIKEGTSAGVIYDIGFNDDFKKKIFKKNEYIGFDVYEDLLDHGHLMANIFFYPATGIMRRGDYFSDFKPKEKIPIDPAALEEFRNACK